MSSKTEMGGMPLQLVVGAGWVGRRCRRNLVYLLSFLFLGSFIALAQSTGAIVGQVQDSTNAAIPGAQINVVNEATGEGSKTVSDEAGRFEFPSLPVGTYTLSADKPNFEHFVVTGIRLDANQTRQAVVVLKPGPTTETVTVSGAVSLLNTTTATLQETVDERRISELPLNGRNPLQLQLLVPGAVNDTGLNNSLTQNAGTYNVVNAIAVNGARGNESNFMLDGGDNNDPLTNTAGVVPNPDALEEFSILTNNYSAEYGRNSGAVVNAITKSGTNNLHGSAYDFVRNDDFDAFNYFSLVKPTLKRNQFGASIGGPVKIPRLYNGHDRTFFFLSWESLREVDASTVTGTVVPTALERTGNFSQSNIMPIDPTTSAPFQGGIIPPGRINTASTNFLNTFIPLPNASNNEYIFNAPTFSNGDQGIVRIDHLLTSKQRIMFRAFLNRNPSTANGGLPLLNATVDFNSINLTASHTYALTPNLLNVGEFTYNHVDIFRGPSPVIVNGTVVNYVSLGVNAPSDTPQFATDWRGGVTGYWTLSQDNLVGIDRNTFQPRDTVTYIHGGHTLIMGGEFRPTESTRVTANLTDPQFTFTGYATTNGLADFLLGLPSVMNQGSLRQNHGRAKGWGIFLQDSWKVTPRVTLSLGVRYEPFYPPYDTANQLSLFRPGQQSTLYPQAPIGLLFEGDPGVLSTGVKPGYNHVAPRVGFAWQPPNMRKTSIREGYGIFYETPNYYELTGFGETQPYSIQETVNAPASWSNPYAGLVNPFPYSPPTNPQQRQAFTFLLPVEIGETLDARLVGGYMQQWNFNIQYETIGNIVLTAAYVGSKGTHLPIQTDQNPAPYAPGATLANIQARRTYPNFTEIDDYTSYGASTYNALQLFLNRRFSHGFTVLANYVYSKSIDNGSSDVYGIWQNPLDLAAEKGISDFDLPQSFVGSFLWALPAPPQRAARLFLGGWQGNGIVTLQSGIPFTLVTGKDQSLTGVGTQRPNLVGNPFVSHRSLAEWYNPAAFALPALGTYGNVGRNTMFGPGTQNMDLSLFREFPIHENYRLQFRTEFFNALNHPNFDNPVATVPSPDAGEVQSAAAPRILQFGLRLAF